MFFYFDKEVLDYRKHSLKTILLSILSLVILILISSVIIATFLYKNQVVTEEAKLIILKEQNAFTKEKLKEYIIQLNIKFPHIVLAQSELETGHYKSTVFRSGSNLFGMKVARIRPTTNSGENLGHAFYNNWRESVQDYAIFQAAYLQNIRTQEEYFEYLRQNYAEDKNYISKLKNIIRKNHNLD